ncbi:MAG: isocitrate lyase/PEP mutase family protein, partial [Rhodospirillales bacterium]
VIEGDTCVNPGSVYDPLSARIAEDVGFEIGMFAGSVASLAVLGAPDHIVLTLSEFTDQAYRICRAGNLALMVDADHGYGNALNVMRTVEELETAGVSGMSIEDTELPTPYGTVGTMQLLSVEEGVGKMKAAVAARQDPQFVIAGRTSAVGVNGVEDAIERVTTYQECGVDMIFLVGVKTRDQLEAVAEKVTLPIMLGGASPELVDKDYLASQGVRIALQTHKPIMSAVQATYDTLKALRDGVAPGDIDYFAKPDLMKQLTRADGYDKAMGSYLKK